MNSQSWCSFQLSLASTRMRHCPHRVPHRQHPFDIAVAPQFQFKQRPSAFGGRLLSHLVRRVEVEREGRHERRHRAEPGQLRYVAISALRIHVPECAVLRAAPGGNAPCSVSRLSPEVIAPFIASIAATTPAMPSPYR
jgi:hypothetical protein